LRHLAKLGYKCVYHDPGTPGRKVPLREVEPRLFLLSRGASPTVVQRDGPSVLYFTLPEHHSLAGKVYSEDLVIFDLCDECSDEFSSWEGELEGAFSAASCVLTASQMLFKKYQKAHPHVFYVPNGADVESFKKPSTVPDDFPKRPGPVAGYHGALSTWLDRNLIYHLSKRLPHWNFVFVGPLLGVSRAELPYGLNIFYLGEKPYEDLASYVNRFDVGIIPFQVRTMTRFCSPIKLFEYLSCGKPVVSTDIYEVRLCPYAYIARNSQEFANYLERALKENQTQPTLSRSREKWAKRNSWYERAKMIDKIIEETVARGVG